LERNIKQMKIISDIFDYPGDDRYTKLAAVLEYSIKKNSPNTPFELIKTQAPKTFNRKQCFASNNHKLQVWLDAMERIQDDIIFLDCDMVVLRDLSDAFQGDFDVAITALCDKGERLPYNGGTVLVRNTEKARAFMREWMKIDLLFYENEIEHCKYRNIYAGMNQASLGKLLEIGAVGAKVVEFDCHEWNWCRDRWAWPICGPGPRILHVKSQTRKSLFLPTPLHDLAPYLRKSVAIWRLLAQEAGIQQYPKDALVVTEHVQVPSKQGMFIYKSQRIGK